MLTAITILVVILNIYSLFLYYILKRDKLIPRPSVDEEDAMHLEWIREHKQNKPPTK